ncbi:MAG: hypothetical protein K2N60_01095 [Oscillospiraceae bacterium]|nr:hypothetical protein [Oscillospiraceae bacterium]
MNIKKLFLTIPICAAVCLSASVGTAFAEDDVPIDDDIIAEEEVPITDGILRGEGRYECEVVYRNGSDVVYDDNGEEYALIGGMSGKLQEGETRESVKEEMTESVKVQYEAIGKNPDDYDFDVYVYFYDDYNLTPQEFLDFVRDDIRSRRQESVSANPPTGNGTSADLAVVSAVLSTICIALSSSRKAKS